MPRPGKSTAEGQRWVYRTEGRRKCWFQAAEETATVKKVRHRVARPRVAAPEDNEAAERKRKAVEDARAELLPSAPAETSQPAPLAPKPKVVDAAPVVPAGAAALVLPAPVTNSPTDQLTLDQPASRQADVEMPPAPAPAASNAVAASVPVPPAAPVALSNAEAADDGQGWAATWLGVLLMALGLVSVLCSSRTLREAMLFARFNARTSWRAMESEVPVRRRASDFLSTPTSTPSQR
ncbi:hypothetical protein [Bradyrhizobium icense]|uniref:hypothetical protein n=1 Tax=Bradyrhizobium icense TaxID=1274631 RepID=UPI0018D32802|nr:hypothetical protein [Bradyrhizobium icense]